MSPESCPNCGADVPRQAKVCPECGSDETTGWSDTAYASNLGLSEEEFDHAEFTREEFGSPGIKPRNQSWLWWVTAVILIVLFAFFFWH